MSVLYLRTVEYQRYSRLIAQDTLWSLALNFDRGESWRHRSSRENKRDTTAEFIDYYRRYTCIIPYQVRLESYRVIYYRIKESNV